jgi:hypothetical protein
MTSQFGPSEPMDPRKTWCAPDARVAFRSLAVMALLVVVGCQASGGVAAGRDGATADAPAGLDGATAEAPGGLDGSAAEAGQDAPASDVPAACQVGATPAQSKTVRFRVRNRGSGTIYTRVANACSMAMTFSSCAAGYRDQLVIDYNVCPCEGGCPAGGPGCPPDGKPLAPGANQDRDVGTLVPVWTTRNGQECATGSRNLPPGRYRWAVRVYPSQADAAANRGGRLYEQDFDLLAGAGQQIVEVEVSLDPPDDGGADASADATQD